MCVGRTLQSSWVTLDGWLGCADFPAIVVILKKNVILKNFGSSWRIATDPAMIMTWHCKDKLDIMDRDIAIFSDVADIAAHLAVDAF